AVRAARPHGLLAPHAPSGPSQGGPRRGGGLQKRLRRRLLGLRRQFPGKCVRLWFEDEARFGTQGTLTWPWAGRGARPRAVRPNGREWVYVWAAVCPATGAAVGMVTAEQDALVSEAFLAELSAALEPDEHALLVWDGGGHHTAGTLNVPANVT